jgi:hypothetical protein
MRVACVNRCLVPINYAAKWRFSFPRAVSFNIKAKFLDEIDIHVLVVVIQSAPNELPTLPERSYQRRLHLCRVWAFI